MVEISKKIFSKFRYRRSSILFFDFGKVLVQLFFFCFLSKFQIFIIDNSPGAYRCFPNNAIPIKSWFCDPMDIALLSLLPLLDALRFTNDVRSVLSRNLHLHRLWWWDSRHYSMEPVASFLPTCRPQQTFASPREKKVKFFKKKFSKIFRIVFFSFI